MADKSDKKTIGRNAAQQVIKEARQTYGFDPEVEVKVIDFIHHKLDIPTEGATALLEKMEGRKTSVRIKDFCGLEPGTSNEVQEVDEVSQKESSTVKFVLADDDLDLEVEQEELERIRREWKINPTRVAKSWYIGSEVEVWSNSLQEWIEAIIVNQFREGMEEWVEVEFQNNGRGAYKQVERYDREYIRPRGILDDDDDSSSEDSSSEYNDLAALQNRRARAGDDDSDTESVSETLDHMSDSGLDEWLSKLQIVVQVHDAGSAEVNGKYKRLDENKPYDYTHEDNPNLKLRYAPDLKLSEDEDDSDEEEVGNIWVFETENRSQRYYFCEEDAEEPGIPPSFGWDEINGEHPNPGVNVFRHDPNANVEEKSDPKVQWGLQFHKKEIEITKRPLGVKFCHIDEGKTLSVASVNDDGEGCKLGIEAEDMLVEVNGEHYASSKETLEVFRGTELPFKCLFVKHKDMMGVLEVRNAGIEACVGRYTISGWHEEDFMFTMNEDPTHRIYKPEEDGKWVVGTEFKEFYTGLTPDDVDEDIEDYPPEQGWDKGDAGKYPVCTIAIHKVHVPPPPQPVVVKVVPHESKATVYLEYDLEKRIPPQAPRMEGWFSVTEQGVQEDEEELVIEIEGLTNGREYKFHVKAVNQITTSAVVVCPPVTPLKVPKAHWKNQGELQGVKGGCNKVTCFFDDVGGKLMDTQAKFSIEAVHGETQEKIVRPAPKSPFVFDELENGVEYTFTIIAENTTATVRSKRSRKMKPLVKPNVPKIIDVENDVAGRKVLVHFECEDWDSKVICAEMVGHTDPETATSKPFKVNPFPVTKQLKIGMPYRFSCSAMNTTAIVRSENESEPFVPLWVPPKPQVKKPRVGRNEAIIKWDCNYNATDEYKVWYTIKSKAGGKSRTTKVTGSILEKTITNLRNGTKYEITVTAHNIFGKSISSKPKFVTPLEDPPEIFRVRATTKKHYVHLTYSTTGGDINDDRYKAEYQIRTEVVSTHSETLKTPSLTTSKGSWRIYDLKDAVTYRFYVKTVNAVGESAEKVSNEVTLQTQHRILGRGNKGIGEMIEAIPDGDDKVLFGLLQVQVGGERVKRFKNICFRFFGENTPNVVRGNKIGMEKEVVKLFKGVHLNLKTFRSKADVTVPEVFKRAESVLLDPSDRKISSAGETLQDIQARYNEQMASPDLIARGTLRQDSILSLNSEISAVSTSLASLRSSVAARLSSARVKQIQCVYRQKYGWIDWVIFVPDERLLELFNRDAYGSGSLRGLCMTVQGLRIKKECFCRFRVVVKKKTMHYLIHFMTEQGQKRNALTSIMTDRLRPANKRIDIYDIEDFTEEYILSRITKEPTAYEKQLDAYLKENEARNEHIERVLAVDQKAAAARDRDRDLLRLKSYVKQIKDTECDLNWVLIDPAVY